MRTLRLLGLSHPSVYAILILVASVYSFGQTATLSTVRNFGSVGMGSTSAASTVTLKNGSTTVALLVSNIATAGDFAQTNNCGSWCQQEEAA